MCVSADNLLVQVKSVMNTRTIEQGETFVSPCSIFVDIGLEPI